MPDSATTHTVTVREPSVFSTEKKKGGAYVLTSDAVTALGAVTTSSTVSDVLDILSQVVHDSHVVSASGIGKASHVDS